MKPVHYLIVLLGALTLSACGGGGGGGGSGGGGGGGGGGTTGATYTIGGSAQGVAMYSSSGMVLQDNGGNNLAVNSDGAFTFSEAVSSGAAYAVTVATQPAGETCTVTGGSGTASANVTTVSVSCSSALAGGSNVASVSVGTFPGDVNAQVFNVPIVTVTVCDATSKCAPIQVVVDTGSSGLRLLASAVTSAGLALTHEADTLHAGNTLSECAYYADGFAWGGVYTAAQVKIANETASNVPIQIIEAGTGPSTNETPPADTPSSCSSASPGGTFYLGSPDSFSADGVLGIGPATQDCGAACVTSMIYYYSCPAGGCTTGTGATSIAALGDEVTNPVSLFTSTKDDNGTLLQLPSIAAGGVATATGYLAFGVGTETDNGIGNATVLPLSGTQPQDQQPLYLTTSFNGTSNINGIIDSGSNAYFFADSSLTQCTTPPGGGTGGSVPPFYCPSTTQSLTATNTGGSATSNVSFQITNFNTVAASMFYAYDDVGGVAPSVNGTTYFDWGLPFFYGRTVYTIIDGTTLGGQTYANGAFAY